MVKIHSTAKWQSQARWRHLLELEKGKDELDVNDVKIILKQKPQ